MISNLATFIQDKRREGVRFAKFCLVGTLGTAIDFGLFNLLHNVLGVHEALSNSVSVTGGIINNYTWSRFWIYPETKDRQGGRKFLQFVVVSIIAWFLNTGILWSADHWLLGERGLLAGSVGAIALALGVEHGVLSSNAAKVLATGIVLFWNFFANRMWTFSDVDHVPDRD